MDASYSVVVLLILCCLSTTRAGKVQHTRCERLQTAGMNLYRPLQEIQDTGMVFMDLPPKSFIEQMMCRIADAYTLDDLTTAIDPNATFPTGLRDMVQLYYIGVTSIIERFMGGIERVEERVEFARTFFDFVRDYNLGEGLVSYDDSYAFSSGLIRDFGEDYLKIFGKGVSLAAAITGQEPFVDENDILGAEKLALAFSGPLYDPGVFSETSGLSLKTSETICSLIIHLTSPPADVLYPLVRQVADAEVTLLYTADDLGLLDLNNDNQNQS